MLVAERCPVVRKSSSSEHTRDKVRRRFTLSVIAENWWDDRAGGHRLWLWGWTWLMSLSATHLNKDNDNGCSDKKLIKCLMDSVDDLSSHWLVRTTSTGDYGVGPLRCGLVRGLFRRQLYHGLIVRLGPLTPVVGSGSASPASHVPRRSTKDRGPKFLCT